MFKEGDIIIGKDYKYPNGALTVYKVDPDGRVHCCPVGGNQPGSFSAEALKSNKMRLVTPEEIAAVKDRPGKFTMDCWENKSWAGWWDEVRWNGWAQPLFELAEAKDIIKTFMEDEYRQKDQKLEYDEANDAIIFHEPDCEPSEIKGVEIEVQGGRKVKVYDICTGNWCWYEVTDAKEEG